ncbi:hypothetical protein I7I48_05723 [Histoplasma ohiense]|nr:hypothetical protein I7I48_05723 [Histoplasma ohiense (nom. inval.)]
MQCFEVWRRLVAAWLLLGCCLVAAWRWSCPHNLCEGKRSRSRFEGLEDIFRLSMYVLPSLIVDIPRSGSHPHSEASIPFRDIRLRQKVTVPCKVLQPRGAFIPPPHG